MDESRRQDAELETPDTKGCVLFNRILQNQAKGGRSRCQKGAAARDTGLPSVVDTPLPPDPSARSHSEHPSVHTCYLHTFLHICYTSEKYVEDKSLFMRLLIESLIT